MKALGNDNWTWTEQTRSAKTRASGEGQGIVADVGAESVRYRTDARKTIDEVLDSLWGRKRRLFSVTRQPIKFFAYDTVALAGDPLQAFAIYDRDPAARIFDYPGSLEYAGRDAYARATYTQHFGKKLVSECKFVAIHPIMSHE